MPQNCEKDKSQVRLYALLSVQLSYKMRTCIQSYKSFMIIVYQKASKGTKGKI